MRAPSLLPPPPSQAFRQAAASLLSECDPDTFAFPDNQGAWGERPSTFHERCRHEMIYRSRLLSGGKRARWIDRLAEKAVHPPAWDWIKRLNARILLPPEVEGKPETGEKIDAVILNAYKARADFKLLFPAFLVFNALAWQLECEALKCSCGVFIPGWDIQAQRRNKAFHIQLKNRLALGIFPDENRGLFLEDALKTLSESFDVSLPELLGEEDRLTQELRLLRESARDPGDEDIHSIILDKIHPPMGVVTLASQAFLYPCTNLLVDTFWPVSSGIPYKAAIMLSVLRDRRSTRSLLEAMALYPPRYTKIRENLIYTLGRLQVDQAAGPIAAVLEGPDEISFIDPGRQTVSQLLIDQKAEALRALGSLRSAALSNLSSIAACGSHPSALLRTITAWSLGDLGQAQKEASGGVSVEIVIALLQLLKSSDKPVFEQAVSSLKKIEMPDFIHNLYLYNAGAVSILGLKPAQKGLYELSETLHHLLGQQNQVVIAVNGDSGTGKTYFCQSLIGGFGSLKTEDILYMMRDRKSDQKIFNRMLGLKWLKTHIDPNYYADYPLSEKEDDPEVFFSGFLRDNADKKLIILDGCRDQSYFQRIIDLFYFHGALDVVVNFRATFSTRRQNLEEREVALESLKTHLSFLEEPALEDTHYYQEGLLTLFDLDNSLSSRLNRQETLELFQKGRISSWGDFIRIGKFAQTPILMEAASSTRSGNEQAITLKENAFSPRENRSFQPEERRFHSRYNEDIAHHPHLIQSIGADDLTPKQIRFYAQNQIAGLGENGTVFVLTFLDNHIFHTRVPDAVDLALLGREIFLITKDGELTRISFEHNESQLIARCPSPPTSLVSFPRSQIITGHADGTIRVWDITRHSVSILQGHSGAVSAVSVDHSGRIISSSRDLSLKWWDLEHGRCVSFPSPDLPLSQLRHYPPGKTLALYASGRISASKSPHSEIHVLNIHDGMQETQILPLKKNAVRIHITADGRILCALKTSSNDPAVPENLSIISLNETGASLQSLRGHAWETSDCLPMGPRIISCGLEKEEAYALSVWGADFFVKQELNRMSLQQPAR